MQFTISEWCSWPTNTHTRAHAHAHARHTHIHDSLLFACLAHLCLYHDARAYLFARACTTALQHPPLHFHLDCYGATSTLCSISVVRPDEAGFVWYSVRVCLGSLPQCSCIPVCACLSVCAALCLDQARVPVPVAEEQQEESSAVMIQLGNTNCARSNAVCCYRIFPWYLLQVYGVAVWCPGPLRGQVEMHVDFQAPCSSVQPINGSLWGRINFL